MKMNSKLRGGFTLVELLVVIVIIAALAGLTAPMVIRQRKKADQTEAVNNARQIGLALMDFETEYTTFPDLATGAAVATATETTAIATLDANSRFRQMIRAGIVESESIFYAKTSFTKKPDGVFNTDERALAPGEVGFSMIVKTGGTAFSAAGNPSRPIIIAPWSGTGETFDSDFFDGKAVVLKLDNSVTSLNIIKSTGNVINNGQPILGVGNESVWGAAGTGGVTPVFVHPLKKN